MSTKILLAAASAFLLITSSAFAQGFAGLGGSAKDFATVVPNKPIVLPDDFAPHPDFRIEWWYVTANLKAEDGTELGLQWTLFRQATKPGISLQGWSSSEFWMGHAAVTTSTQHLHAEKLARGGTGQAGATAEPTSAWIDDWQFASDGAEGHYLLSAAATDFSYALQLTQKGPAVRHGQNGYSVKSDAGQASYYFSLPFLDVEGTVSIGGQTFKVAGDAWLDREWSSQPLADNQRGWDWFSLKFDTGARLMVFGLRDETGGVYRSGSWITPEGILEPLDRSDIALTPLSSYQIEDRRIPTHWRVQVRSKEVDLEVTALNPNSWMNTSIPYWEGPVATIGSHSARGYLEMTGY